MNKSGFTLIEVLISVVIIFIISMALVKISSQNFSILEKLTTDKTAYASGVLHSTSEFRDLSSYINIQNIDKPDAIVEKKVIPVGDFTLIQTDKFQVMYTLQKVKVKINKQEKSYVQIK